MSSRRQILLAHYARLLKKAAAWSGMLALMSTMFVAVPASAAGQITTRSTTPSTSVAGATATYTTAFTLATSGQTVGAFKLEICDSPLSTTACANTGNSSGATFTGATFGSVTCAACGGTAFAGGTFSGNSATVTHTAAAVTGTPSVTIVINNVTNPSAANKTYYVRVSSYSDTAATTPAYPGTDFGAMALSTTTAVVVSANVQESLTFCTGTSGANCAGISGSTVSIGTTADNILTSGTPSGGLSLMYVDTNAASGYAITYTSATGFVSGANTVQAANNQTMATCASGAPNGDCFGINAAVNTATGLGTSAAPSGGTAPTMSAGYGTNDTYKFVGNGSAQPFSSVAGPTTTTTYKVSYAAQAGPTTKPGSYSATFVWIATGTF